MIRIHHHEREVGPEKVIEMFEWLLNNFNFERGEIRVNNNEDVVLDRLALENQMNAARWILARDENSRVFSILRTLYFDDEDAEKAILYQMKFT